MGIPFLYTFVTKQVSNCLMDVDIIQETENWFRINNEKPIIIIDFPAFTHAICNSNQDSFVGGRNECSLLKLESFLHKLTINACVVFFEDGPVQVEKSENVIKRQHQKYQEIYNVLDDLYQNNKPISSLVRDHSLKLHGSLPAGLRATARRFGKLHKSFHNECDKEIAAYANKVNALAVISDDTDFLIYEGKWQYWSSRHLNFETFTTKNYCKSKLHACLRLEEYEMPLFATLAGNDIISRDLLDGFHRYLGNPRYKFQNISRYIALNFRKVGLNDPYVIARKVFGNTSELAENIELIKKSLNSYNTRELTVDQDNDDDFLQFIKVLENDCYAYMLDFAKSNSISYFDVRQSEFSKYPMLSLDLVRRQMGVILQHKNDSNLTRHIYCYKDGKYVYETLIPVYPPIPVPNLADLYNSDKNDELKMIKLKLLKWSLSVTLDINSILSIDKKFLCACLSLFYMVENGFVTVQEADIFLHMIATVYENFATIRDMPYIQNIHHRAFQLIFLYDKMYQHIVHVLSNVGLFELIEHNRMDGLYFHHVYNKIKNGEDCALLNDQLQGLRLYRDL